MGRVVGGFDRGQMMDKRTKKRLKQQKHHIYVKNKSFYRKFGRKPYILLTREKRKLRRPDRNSSRTKNDLGPEPTYITLPEVLSLEKDYRTDFLEAIDELRTHIPNNNQSFIIDHSHIRRIDPEALLILAAEIKRSTTYREDKRRLKYLNRYAPKDEKVKKMLNAIGYWEHFNIKKNSSYDEENGYFKIIHDVEANNNLIVDIREFFKEKLNFLKCYDVEEAFDIAITEAIANAVEHAYIKKPAKYFINKAWWLSGHYNKETKELFFGCYDQGIGVRDGLSNNDERSMRLWNTLFVKPLKKDSAVIDILINKPLPKYKDKDRGYGFKQFIKLIEKYSTGSLNVYSNKGHCRLIKDRGVIIQDNYDHKDSINGTLIVWKIKLEEGVEHGNI